MKILDVRNMTFEQILLGNDYYIIRDYENTCAKGDKKLDIIEINLHTEHRKKHKYKMTWIERNLWNRRNSY